MGKAKEDKQQPAHVAELLKNGTAVLTAKTRDELAEMVNDIPADVAYQAGAVGHNHETGEYTLRIDIANH
jgi:urease gamma subunit